MKHCLTLLSLLSTCLATVTQAEDATWFIKPNLGMSALSDFSANLSGEGGQADDVNISTHSGVVTGLAIGYQYNKNISAELAWEYRTNDSTVTFDSLAGSYEGDYASNTFYINGIYQFDAAYVFKPYLGLGLAWVQEVDIDVLIDDQERSSSANGDVGFQLFGGVSYEFNERAALQVELRLTDISSIELRSEQGTNDIFSNVEYRPFTLQVGLKYRF